MGISTEERIEALEVALNNESREREFYLQHSERTNNPLGKEMFKAIADDELEHYQRLLELHKKLKDEGRWPESLPLKVKGTGVRAVLDKAVAGVGAKSTAEADDLEAVKIAIDFETRGEEFYARLRDGVEDPLEKEFYGLLASMEREHRLSLEDTLEYFKDPEGWYRVRERLHVDGA